MHGNGSLVERPPVRSAAENEADRPDHAQRRLQADVYASFNSLYEGDKEEEAACWEQARRHFYDVHVATKQPVAGEALVRIGKFYEI